MAQKAPITCVKITMNTFIHGIPVGEGMVVPNQKVHATEQDMKDLIAYKKAVVYKAEPETARSK